MRVPPLSRSRSWLFTSWSNSSLPSPGSSFIQAHYHTNSELCRRLYPPCISPSPTEQARKLTQNNWLYKEAMRNKQFSVHFYLLHFFLNNAICIDAFEAPSTRLCRDGDVISPSLFCTFILMLSPCHSNCFYLHYDGLKADGQFVQLQPFLTYTFCIMAFGWA